MANIKRYLDKIRTAIYGKEVRGSLADGLEAINKETEDATEVALNVEQRQDTVEQQFDDVLAGYSEDRPISNEETIAARTNRETGENHQTLGQRLDAENKKVNEQLAEKAKQSDLDTTNKKIVQTEQEIETLTLNKAGKALVESEILSLNVRINGIDRGYGDTYATLDELETAHPDGDNKRYVVSENGHWYYWSGTKWSDGGVFQAVGIADNSITDNKLAENYLNSNLRKSKNLFNKKTATKGYYVSASSGYLVPLESSSYSEFIKIDSSKISLIVSGINSNYSGGGAFYSSNTEESFISGFDTVTAKAGLSIPSNALFIRISVPIADLSTAQIEYGTDAHDYEEFGRNYLEEKSLPLHVLTDEAINELSSTKKFEDKNFLTIGDSITWLDGRTVSNYDNGNTRVIGYQEQFRKQGAIVTNKGNSGATIAKYTSSDTGQHGSLYDDIVTNNYDVAVFDIITILAGTNDVMYKQGNYGVVGDYEDTSFDTTTTLGALRGLLEYILTNNPTAEIYVFAPFFSNDLSRTRERMLDINKKMKQVCDLYNVPCAETYTRLGINKFNFTRYFYDNTHPKNEGMEKLGKFMVSQVI